MADQVSAQQLRRNLSDYLRRANAGETITITRLGRDDAVLGPVSKKETSDVQPWISRDE